MQKTLLAAAICQVLVSNFSGSSYTFGGCRVLSAREHESDEPQVFVLPEGEAQALMDYLHNENPHLQIELRPFLPGTGEDGEGADSTDPELIDPAQTDSSLALDVVADPVDENATDAADEPQTDTTDEQAAVPEVQADDAGEQQADAGKEPAPKSGRAKASK